MSNYIGELKIGMRTASVIKATEEKINAIAAVSGDYNPIHVDEEYACRGIFGKKIAHGLFCLAEVSRLIGMDLPGEGSILVEESVHYNKPVYVGEAIEVSVEIQEITKEKSLFLMVFSCQNENKEVVMNGTAKVKVMR